MSEGTYNAPAPQKSGGGGKTIMIVLAVFGVLGLVCVGICGVMGYGLFSVGKTAVATGMAVVATLNIQQDATVTAELGDDLTPENAKMEMQGQNMIIDFDVKGTKATGKAHAEFQGGDPNDPSKQGKISVLRVTLPSGQTVNVSTEPPSFEVTPTDSAVMPEEPSTATPPDSTDPPEETN